MVVLWRAGRVKDGSGLAPMFGYARKLSGPERSAATDSLTAGGGNALIYLKLGKQDMYLIKVLPLSAAYNFCHPERSVL